MTGEHMNRKILSIQEVYREGKERLERAGIADAGIDAWYLLEYVTGIDGLPIMGIPAENSAGKRRSSISSI